MPDAPAALGHRKLDGVTRADLARLVGRLTADELSPSTVQTTILPLRAIYRRALEHEEVTANPTVGLACQRSAGAASASPTLPRPSACSPPRPR